MTADILPLMGAGEIQKRLGVCRQRVHQLTTQPEFPAPVAVLSKGKIWSSEAVEQWIRQYRPQAADRAA